MGSERLLTVPELAERLSVPVATIYRWNYRGEGPRRLQVGKHVRYRLDDVLAWEEQHVIREQQ
jgi:excisionase family DNA binding protein